MQKLIELIRADLAATRNPKKEGSWPSPEAKAQLAALGLVIVRLRGRGQAWMAVPKDKAHIGRKARFALAIDTPYFAGIALHPENFVSP